MSEAQLSGRESPEEGPSKKGHRRVKSMVKELEQSKPGEMAPGASNGDTSISRISGPNVSGNESLIASSPDSSALANQSSLSTTHSNFNDAHFDHSFDSASSSTTALSQQDKDDAAAEAAEESDVFLPLSPHPGSASPFKIGFNAGHSPSPTTPSFPPSLTAAERREHSRRHSRIHSRNLSVFFPKPGSEEANELASSVPSPGTAAGSHLSPLHIPNANVRAYATEGANGEAKVHRPPALAKTSPQGSTSPVSHTHTRRGHHHRHSMSHSFNEPSMPVTPDGSGSSTPLSASAPKVASALSFSTPTSLPTGTGSSLRNKYGHLPALIRCALVCAFHLPFRTQASLALAVAELGLGGLLWIYGQSGESLAVTGLGYLVVFDAVGALCNVLVENRQDVEVLYEVMSPGARDHLRHPFGTHRLTTLAHFAQAIYLLFSGVYVCKESIEHVLLLHEPVDSGSGADGHGSAHGSMGHGEGRGVASAPADEWLEIWISMPTGLLFLATACCLCTALLLSNHVKMTEAVGPSTYALRARSPINALSLLSNPFSLLVLFFSSILAVASFTISAVQLAPLDKVLALLESIAMFYVAYPAAEATGKVLLQVAPPKEAPAMRALYKGIKDIEGHPSVLFVPKPHVWQLTPHPREDEPDEENHGGMLSSSRSRRLARNSPVGQSHCLLVANVKIHLKGDVKDDELLSVTQYARERCAKAFRGGTDGDQAIGELHVSCVKGMQDDFLNGDHDHHHHDPDHGHHHHGHHGHHGHHHHHSHQHEHRSHCHSGHDHSHHAH